MPSSYTTNYKLNQWKKADRVLMEDFNADNAKIDAALKAEASARAAADTSLNTALGKKADASALNSLKTTVDGKADQSALAGKADVSTLNWVSGQVTSLDSRALRAKYGSYTGTGTYGASNARSLTFDRAPVLLIVRPEGGFEALVLVRGLTDTSCSMSTYGSGTRVTVSWSGNQVSWYGGGAMAQMNESGTTYRYVALY